MHHACPFIRMSVHPSSHCRFLRVPLWLTGTCQKCERVPLYRLCCPKGQTLCIFPKSTHTHTHTYTDTSHRLLHLLTHLLPSAPEVAASVRTSWDGRRPTGSGSGSHYRRKQVYWTSETLGRFWFSSSSSSASWGNSVEMAIQGRCTDMICPPLSLSVASRTESTQKFTETIHTLAHTDKRLWATSQQKSFHKNILFCCHHSLLLLRAHWLLCGGVSGASLACSRELCMCACVSLCCCFVVLCSVQFSSVNIIHSLSQSLTHSHTHFVGIRKDDISFYLCALTFTITQTHTHIHLKIHTYV